MELRKQGGLSIIGFMLVLAMTLFVTFIGMRIVPLYIEYYSVVNAVNGVAAERGSAHLSLRSLRIKVLNRLYVSYSDNVKEAAITKVRRNGIYLRVAYEVRKPVIGNLDVIAKFDKSARLSN